MLSKLKSWQYNLLTCAVYLLFAVFTMQVLNTLSVWPPAGVALAAVILFGRGAWLGIALGTFFTVIYHFYLSDLNPFTLPHIAINFATTTGNTLAALCAFIIIDKQLKKQDLFTRVANVAGNFILACVAIGLISAIFGVGVYFLIGEQWIDGLFKGILNWSISNSLAAMVISPALYFLWRRWPYQMAQETITQSVTLSLIIIATCYLVFGPGYKQLDLPILQPSLLLFPLLYCAIRLSPTTTSCMNMLVFFLAWIGGNQGWGYFYYHHSATAEVSMQFFFLFIFTAVLLVQAVFSQRQNEQEHLTTLLEQKVEERTHELERAKESALKLAVTDPLTQIYNRRGFFKTANKVFSQYLRHQGNCAMLLLDLDKFKSVNDKYGHATGDEVIKATAKILTLYTRDSDIVGRIGGEEFVVFLPMSNLESAVALAQRIRQGVEKQILSCDEHMVEFTVSIGVSALQKEDQHIEALLKRADKALYIAKESGRNQVQSS
ncbi:sensor domain-containing diguanylate cyclase [Pseudoalteromonas sp. G4]|uniref:sensor domain-containing diguanylate cyclase n=1 Tax=Pseudoalteromonas sp. G4 TaxID=2992761 RepID=UPI00237E819B|nr:diguanylate cyclase [Pseudoalteromonas sp. G4]MDE3270924.1 diguanylate cyclase [Pseudoalteromonas sp. G4]